MFTPTLSRSAAKTHVDFVSGPVKIKDALYIGDELAARDMDFIVSNKVTHIINTVVKRVPNLFEKYGIQYLSVNWTEKEPNIFDKKNNAIGMIFNFIEEAMDQGESVLVHSLHGKSRSGSVVIAYLMKKYSWSLQKTFDYVVSKKDSFKIRSHFMSQLNELEKRLVQSQTLSSGWNTASNQEDLVLANTMKNVKIIVGPEKQVARKGKKKISWGEKKVIGSEVKSSGQNYLTSTFKYSQFKDGLGIKKLRSILKDPNSEQPQQPNMDARQQKNLEQIQISPYKQNKNIETPKKTNDSWNEEERLAKSQIIGSKNTSHGHVVMNNFMGVDKPRNERYSSIPVRETKDRQKKLQSKSGSRLAPYENIISTMKSPYDINFMNRIGEGNKARKREQPREYPRNTAQQRPHSVNLGQSQKQKPLTAKPGTKEQIMYSSYANSNRNRNVWPVQRQNIIRYK